MKRAGTLLVLCLLMAGITAVEGAQPETKLMRSPDISKEQVVFVYPGDHDNRGFPEPVWGFPTSRGLGVSVSRGVPIWGR
jgi:hypothetical protein